MTTYVHYGSSVVVSIPFRIHFAELFRQRIDFIIGDIQNSLSRSDHLFLHLLRIHMQIRRKLSSNVKRQPSDIVAEGIEFIISPRFTCVLIEKECFQHHGIGDVECLREIYGVDTSASLTHLDFVVRVDQKIERVLGSDTCRKSRPPCFTVNDRINQEPKNSPAYFSRAALSKKGSVVQALNQIVDTDTVRCENLHQMFPFVFFFLLHQAFQRGSLFLDLLIKRINIGSDRAGLHPEFIRLGFIVMVLLGSS